MAGAYRPVKTTEPTVALTPLCQRTLYIPSQHTTREAFIGSDGNEYWKHTKTDTGEVEWYLIDMEDDSCE